MAHMWQLVHLLAKETLDAFRPGRRDAYEVVVFDRYQKRFNHFGEPRQGRFKALESFVVVLAKALFK